MSGILEQLFLFRIMIPLWTLAGPGLRRAIVDRPGGGMARVTIALGAQQRGCF